MGHIPINFIASCTNDQDIATVAANSARQHRSTVQNAHDVHTDLRTNVAQGKGLVQRLLRAFVVCSRRQVPSVIPAIPEGRNLPLPLQRPKYLNRSAVIKLASLLSNSIRLALVTSEQNDACAWIQLKAGITKHMF
eukprot:8952198-Pyramimonas_sp.AAC.1